MFDYVSMAEAFRKIRKKKHMTQLDVAVKSGVAISTLRAMEAGTYNVTLATLEALAGALDCELSIEFIDKDAEKLPHLKSVTVELINGKNIKFKR